LDSVQSTNQNEKFQVVVVDNASSDETAEIINEKKTKNLDFIQNTVNVGFTKAVNQGVKIAGGEYILILNPDTQLTEGSVERLMETISSDSTIGLVAPQLRFPDRNIQYSCRRFPTFWNVITEMTGLSWVFSQSNLFNGWKMRDFNHATERDVDQPAGAALMVKKDLLNGLGGLDEHFPMFFSDVDLCKRIKDMGKRIVFCPDAVITHRGGSTTLGRRPGLIASSHLSLIKYFMKHHRRIVDFIPNWTITFLLLVTLPFRIIGNLLFPRNRVGGQTL
jgi:GT2 family glycosyltransferase